jgi:hypothetical protein
MWEQHKQEEDWGFLLIDARNAFNEQNQTGLLWTVWHEWPLGARFVSNCYKHWSMLVKRDSNGTGTFLAYGVGILPLIHILKLEFLALEQPWYADDAGVTGKFDDIRCLFVKLQEIGLDFGYFPEPSKSILIVPELNVARAEISLEGLEFQITTGSRSLGGFIGEDPSCLFWTAEITAAGMAVPSVSLNRLWREICRG